MCKYLDPVELNKHENIYCSITTESDFKKKTPEVRLKSNKSIQKWRDKAAVQIQIFRVKLCIATEAVPLPIIFYVCCKACQNF